MKIPENPNFSLLVILISKQIPKTHIADLVGCNPSTITRWIDGEGIPKYSQGAKLLNYGHGCLTDEQMREVTG